MRQPWRRTSSVRRAFGTSAVALTLVLAGNVPAWAAPSAAPQLAACATTPAVPAVPAGIKATAGSPGAVYSGVLLAGSQVDAAATIVNVGLDAGVGRRGIKIAIAAAMQSSSLNGKARHRGHLGLFQQLSDPKSGLYTGADRMDPVGAARMFFDQLVKRVPGYDADGRSDAEIGDAVQESGDTDRIAAWADLAEALTAQFIPVAEPTIAVADAAATTTTYAPQIYFTLRDQHVAFATPPGRTLAGITSSTFDPTVSASASSPGSASIAAASNAVSSSTAAVSTAAATTPTGDNSTTEPTASGTSTAPVTEPPSTAPSTTEPSTTAPSTTAPSTTDTSTTAPSTTDTSAPDTSSSDTSSSGTSTTAPSTTDPSVPPITDQPAELPAPPVVDTAPPAPATSGDPNLGPDTVSSGRPSATIDCAPNNNAGSTTFDPGSIISDEVFYNSGAMSADQIQSFLANAGSNCSGSLCVKDLRISSADIPADQYCNAYPGGTDELASAVIAKVSVACGINPQVMLVTLQKESALLTKSTVSSAAYNAAWGWHCPDSGPGGSANCDPRYAGFFNQAFGMAKQWSRYRVDPGKYHYQAGQTATILWNVAQTGCGGSDVTIKNTATASLYNYTPYQPNAAALASYPGVGDKCSAYGNRNFFFLFQKYFGVTGGGQSAAISVNGVQVTIPNSPYVAPAVRGATISAPNESVARGLAAGFASIGLPYIWGGGTVGGPADQGCSRGGGSKNSCAGAVGFDCSGLTAYVISQAGFAIGTNSGSQRAGGLAVSWNQATAGDIIGYSGHVAIYLGKINGVDYLLEAPDVGKFVQIRPVYFLNGGRAVDSVVHRYWG